jgi:hypothetical protein
MGPNGTQRLAKADIPAARGLKPPAGLAAEALVALVAGAGSS